MAREARPVSSAEILNLLISRGSAENFPFIVADVFLNSAVERTYAAYGDGREREEDDDEYKGELICVNCQ